MLDDRILDVQRRLIELDHAAYAEKQRAAVIHDDALDRVNETREKAQQTGNTEDENDYIRAAQQKRLAAHSLE